VCVPLLILTAVSLLAFSW